MKSILSLVLLLTLIPSLLDAGNEAEPPLATISGTASVIVRDIADFGQVNADNDFYGINEGSYLQFSWSKLPEGTTKIALSRASSSSGPWTEVLIGEGATNLTPVKTFVYTDHAQVPPDFANDYFYKLEAFSATGQLLKSYAPVFIPKFVGP